jgi:hypothetical protein
MMDPADRDRIFASGRPRTVMPSSSAPPSQGKIPRKTLALNGPVFGERIIQMQ